MQGQRLRATLVIEKTTDYLELLTNHCSGYVHEIRELEDRITVFIFCIGTKVPRHSAGSVGMWVNLTDSTAIHLIVFITNRSALHMLSTTQTILQLGIPSCLNRGECGENGFYTNGKVEHKSELH